MTPKTTITYNFLILITLLLTIGCAKTSIDEVPSYIAIDTASITVSGNQGTSSQKISDVWVYAGNDLIGAFEMPAKFPVLKSGPSTLSIFAGIKLNGINETRAPYPFYERITKTVTLEREKVLDLGHQKFTYVANTKFAWQENFEELNTSIEPTSRSEINMARVQLPELKTAFPGELNEFASKIVIPNDTLIFECASYDSFKLPTDGKSVFLELNYKTNNTFTMGIFANGVLTEQRSILVINPNSNWNKIYINLTPTLSGYTNASSFKIFFAAIKNTTVDKAEIYIDNIKLLHF